MDGENRIGGKGIVDSFSRGLINAGGIKSQHHVEFHISREVVGIFPFAVIYIIAGMIHLVSATVFGPPFITAVAGVGFNLFLPVVIICRMLFLYLLILQGIEGKHIPVAVAGIFRGHSPLKIRRL